MDDYLQHYGVLGMKWGVRRKRPKASVEVSNTKPRKKTVSELSDDELRRKINRIQMEKQLAQLTAKEKSAGAKFVSDVVTNAAKQTATTYTTKFMNKGMEAMIQAAAKKNRS